MGLFEFDFSGEGVLELSKLSFLGDKGILEEDMIEVDECFNWGYEETEALYQEKVFLAPCIGVPIYAITFRGQPRSKTGNFAAKSGR